MNLSQVFRLTSFLAFLILGVPLAALAAPPRVLPEGKQPDDVRLAAVKDLDGYFPLAVPQSQEAWTQRADLVRRQLLASQGLWPLPTKTPLKAVIHGKIDKGDYTVERVYFESMPGFFVTGSLYRPKGKSGKVPGVLSPHGHWANGRFHDAGEEAAKQSIATGAEKFEPAARSPLQARQVQLARMGCVAFHYDMLGYADSTQLSFELVHRFGKQRPEMNKPDGWGFYSPQAESHLQSVMGLQTWNSIRALDFLLSLPEVDADRVAVSGASGGGTQSFMLAALDPRVTLAFPAVMVSTAMQGGCTCENSCLVRVGTGNIEIAGLFAPKPLGMTAADDWTKEMATKGFPELQALYRLLGKPDNVMLAPLVQFPHNYNYPSRQAFYGWLNKHFELGLSEPIEEREFDRLTTEQMTVWDSEHPRPEGGEAFERKLAAHWHADAQNQIAADTKQEIARGGIEAILGRRLPKAGDVAAENVVDEDQGSYIRFTGLVRNKPRGEALPVALLHPKNWNQKVVVWLSDTGKAAIFDAEGKPSAEAQKLLDAGTSVAGVDLLFQGESLATGQSGTENRRVKNGREFAGYTYGYNHSLLAQRAHDVLTVLSFFKHHEQKPAEIRLVALDGTAPAAAVALAVADGAVNKAALDTHGFRFVNLPNYVDANFLPGGAKYGDLPGFLIQAGPAKLWLAGETSDAVGLPADATRFAGPAEESLAAAWKWIAE